MDDRRLFTQATLLLPGLALVRKSEVEGRSQSQELNSSTMTWDTDILN